MKNDLIERVKKYHPFTSSDRWETLQQEILTTLSPVLPEETNGMLEKLMEHNSHRPRTQYEREAANLIERLASWAEIIKQERDDYRDKYIQDSKRLHNVSTKLINAEQRIEELENDSKA